MYDEVIGDARCHPVDPLPRCSGSRLPVLLKRDPGDLGILPWFANAASRTKGVSLLGSTLAVLVLVVMWFARL